MTDHALDNLRQAEQEIEDYNAVVGRMQERIVELEAENARLRDLLRRADAVVTWETTPNARGFQDEIEAALGIGK